MPMLMLKCKTCGMNFQGLYMDNPKSKDISNDYNQDRECSRGHKNSYNENDYIDFS